MTDSLDVKAAMTWLGQQPDTLFLGQGVGVPGTKLSESFADVPADKRIEFPVAENLQLGVSIGLALEGFVPISVFPRIDFLLCAMDQLVLHLDKLPFYSDGGYRPKVIVRTAIGSKTPLDAGPQHTGDYTFAMRAMLKNVTVRLHSPEIGSGSSLSIYAAAYKRRDSTLVVEG